MVLDTIILLVRNENWPQANLHVTKGKTSFNKNVLCKCIFCQSSYLMIMKHTSK